MEYFNGYPGGSGLTLEQFWRIAGYGVQMTITVKKLNVAILDDYQNVSHHFANWYKLSDKIEVDVLNEYIGREENYQIFYLNMMFYV